MAVDVGGGCLGQAHGALSDEGEPPRLQLTGLEPMPASAEAVERLDRMGEVAPPGLRSSGRALRRTRRWRTQPPPDTPHRPAAEPDSCHASTGPTNESVECSAAHFAAAAARRVRVVLGGLVCPSDLQHRGGVVAVVELGWVNGRGHRGTNSTSDRRHSNAQNPLVHKGFRDRDRNCDGSTTAALITLRQLLHLDDDVSRPKLPRAAAAAKPTTVTRPAMSPALRVASGIMESISITRRAPAAKPLMPAWSSPEVLSAIAKPTTVANAQTTATTIHSRRMDSRFVTGAAHDRR